MSNLPETRFEKDHHHLVTAVGEVRAILEKFLQGEDRHAVTELPDPAPQLDNQSKVALPDRTALDTLCRSLGLSSFERALLLMCAGTELDSRFATIYAAAHGDARRTQPSFGLALAAFKDAHWSALSQARPLRYWHLVDIGNGETLTTSPLRISERVLCYLTGVYAMDERLEALIRPVPVPETLAPSRLTLADEIVAVWERAASGSPLPVINLCGDDLTSKRAIAAVAAARCGLRLYRTAEWKVPRNLNEIEIFLRLWERESILSAGALLVECDDRESGEGLPPAELAELMESVLGPLFVASVSPRRSVHRCNALFYVNKLAASEQRDIWHGALETALPRLNGEVEGLVSQFSLNELQINSAATQVIRRRSDASTRDPSLDRALVLDQLWDACRVQARPRLEGLAQRVEPAAGWDDLVLPVKQKEILKQIAVHVRQRSKVYQTWGFASKGSRGLGISALFAGPSGTGKTMAAEVLANDLRLDLYRIDLSQVVSKYIGETEKNLRRVFDAAEEGAAVLLFDEADALFGKRSEVKDSHDRYANIEVSYLLQRMEAYRGLAILTSNRKTAIDQAFLRRIRFVADFPFPDLEQRHEIWSRVFPALTPTRDLRIDRLARLNASGGHIRNIAMGAAFLAADALEPVRMEHLLLAARNEFAKMEKTLTDSEIAGWV
jgi:hypothetical protein